MRFSRYQNETAITQATLWTPRQLHYYATLKKKLNTTLTMKEHVPPESLVFEVTINELSKSKFPVIIYPAFWEN